MHDTALHMDPENTSISLKSGDSFILNPSRTTQGFFMKSKHQPTEQQPTEQTSFITMNENPMSKTQNKSKCIDKVKLWFRNNC
jgi:hypothetical protein